MQCEKKMIAKLNKNQALEAQVQPPRMIIVTQDRDYWPGSEKDPEAMRRRAIKEKAFAEISQGRHMGYVRPGYMLINVPPNLDDDYSDVCGRGLDFYDRAYCQRFFDPSLPGTKFILDNYDQKELEDGFGGLDAIAEMMGWEYP
ncbi:uncharacterized protein LOC132273676 isoform X2 [Cornus florida]|uniref:uncharacterized protein LOC132273676 isoform X2 n=1 Tax=Cornus florida TaxID=4283 RepID=UPI00289C2C79|nr:uncharacterized protein LOC132273676 isoform X2 [Cornus florida]